MANNVNKVNQSNDYGAMKPKIDVDYSALKMANTNQGTGDMGYLIPAHIHEMLPSQKISLNQDIALQFNPFVTNLFHEINGEMMTYFVPNRIIWDEWETFIIGGTDGQDATVHPTYDLRQTWIDTDPTPANRTLAGTLADYFNMPINWDFENASLDGTRHRPTSFLWWGYNAIYNEHIRVIDFEPTEIDKDNNTLLRGNYDHDYFTRSRVYQQRGIIPSIPISDELEQLAHGYEMGTWSGSTWTEATPSTNNVLKTDQAVTPLVQGIRASLTDEDTLTDQGVVGGSVNTVDMRLMPHSLTALGMNMNDFMIGLGVMRVQINNAKIQPRYIEQLQMRFGIFPQDARLTRPEYIKTDYFNIALDTVTQTSEGSVTKQGNITGQAWGNGQNMSSTYEAKEHGYLFTMFIIKPKSVYEGGLDRRWLKRSRYDYATPELANLPDREVYQGELMHTGQTEVDEVVFGWQGQYEEYRTLKNNVCGRLRPSDPTGLKSYTLARYWEVGSPPLLNKEFIGVNPDQDRILQYTDEPAFVYFLRNTINTAIPLPFQAEPGDLSFL